MTSTIHDSGDTLRLKLKSLEREINAIKEELTYRGGDGNESIMAYHDAETGYWIAGESDAETYDLAVKAFGEEGGYRVTRIYVRDKSFFDSSLI